MEQTRINLAAELERSVVNGPGVRYVIWVQGCPFRCPGCYNQDFLPFVANQLVNVDTLAERILSVSGIEGVTYTGGEPMMQAEALYRLTATLKAEGLTTVCYTGFTMDELKRRRNSYVSKLLGLVDVLIDGRYDEKSRANLPWRGSSNQRVHFLTDAYAHLNPVVEAQYTEMELVVDKDGMTVTGVLQDQIMSRLLSLLERNE